MQVLYSAARHISLIFSTPPRNLPSKTGVTGTTGLLTLTEREPVAEPRLDLTIRAVMHRDSIPATAPLHLDADGTVLVDAIPFPVRLQDGVTATRALVSMTVSLSPDQTLELLRAKDVRGTLGAMPFAVSVREQSELRAIAQVGVCGAQKPW